MEANAEGRAVCLANVNGELCAVDNVCPHRHGPLGQGWVEGGSIVCPWHSWTFSLKTGEAEFPVHARVVVFPVRVQGDDVLIEVESADAGESISEHPGNG
jgi:nitrite reductase (NADH) small subunit